VLSATVSRSLCGPAKFAVLAAAWIVADDISMVVSGHMLNPWEDSNAAALR
jgi:hypothetical protein